MYAVVSTQWHQYIVSEWDEITVDLMSDLSEWDEVILDSVLCVFDEDASTVSVWTPVVSWASVKAKLIRHQLWDKVRVMKFQSKKRYQKVTWFRAKQSVLQIEKISS